MHNLKSNRSIKQAQIHTTDEMQLSHVGFATPLQQVLQQKAALLRLLDQQNRWQLWISSRQMLQRHWIEQSGLNAAKVVQIATVPANTMVDLIEKALMSKQNSYVVACVNIITDHDKHRLQRAVRASGTHLFLVDDEYLNHDDFMMLSKQIAVATH